MDTVAHQFDYTSLFISITTVSFLLYIIKRFVENTLDQFERIAPQHRCQKHLAMCGHCPFLSSALADSEDEEETEAAQTISDEESSSEEEEDEDEEEAEIVNEDN